MPEQPSSHSAPWGATLRRYREAADRTQENLAAILRDLSAGALSTTARSVHDWETRNSLPRRVSVELVAALEQRLVSLAAAAGRALPPTDLSRAFEARKNKLRGSIGVSDGLREIETRAQQSKTFTMFAITAHNIDEIYSVDRLVVLW